MPDNVEKTPKPDMTEIGMDAFTKGLEAANAGVKPEDTFAKVPAAPIVPEPKTDEQGNVIEDDAPTGDDPAANLDDEGGEPELDGEGKPKPKVETDPAKKPEGEDEDDQQIEEFDEEKFDAQIEQDIKAMREKGSSEKSINRYQSLANRVKELEPVVVQLEERARTADEWEHMVTSTGATPKQFGNALSYLQLIASEDPVKMKIAFDAMAKEQEWLAQKLGLAAGSYDPLNDFPDLKKRVEEDFSLSREDALELASLRKNRELVDNKDKREIDSRTLEQQEDYAVQQITELRKEIIAKDPDHEYKIRALIPIARRIQQTVHPSKWVEETVAAYRAIPALPKKPHVKVNSGPIHVRDSQTDMHQVPKDPFEAFSMGVDLARKQGK